MEYKGSKVNVVLLLQERRFAEVAKKKGIKLEELSNEKLHTDKIGTALTLVSYKHNNSRMGDIFTYEFVESNGAEGFGVYAFQSTAKVENPIELLEQYLTEVQETIKSFGHTTSRRDSYSDFISNPNSSIEN